MSKRPPQRKPAGGAKPPKIGAKIEVKLDTMGYSGAALGRYAGRRVSVPFGIPGETIRAEISKDDGRQLSAIGLSLVEASADRVRPRCPHFGGGRCGQCAWQHIAPDVHHWLKQDIWTDSLLAQGFAETLLEAALHPTIAAPQAWGYAHHARLFPTPDGWAHRRADGSLEAISECAILHPALWEFVQTLDVEMADLKSISVHLGSDSAPMVILEMSSEDVPELLADLPASVNVLLPDNEPLNLVGASHVRHDILGRSLRATAGSFFRANIGQLPALIDVVLATLALAPGATLLDCYAGVGFFSAFAAPWCSRVVVMESYPPAVTDADENLADYAQIDLVEGSVEEVLDSLADVGDTFDAAIVDPPPSGMSDDALSCLLDVQPKRIAYVGNNPASLGRAAKALLGAGYTLTRLQGVDLAPHTPYLEMVAGFSKA